MVTSYETKAGVRWRVAIRSSKYENHFKGGFVRERDAKDYECRETTVARVAGGGGNRNLV